ncbi:GDP-L-galactose phosphorylase [Bertholletia excelsa]
MVLRMDIVNEPEMLSKKRVPTVVSNYQEDDSKDTKIESLGCGRNCLGKCCLPVSKLPLYAFKKDEDNSIDIGEENSSDGYPMTFLNSLLLGLWEEKMAQGLFQFDVTTCKTKIIPGSYGFIAQLNKGHHLKKRPAEFCVNQVLQPFDEIKFNFTKVSQEEVLLRLEKSYDSKSHFFPSSPVDASASSPNVIAINVSPIEYGHVLLIPHVLDCLPQRIDHESFLLALHMSKECADPFFRLGYNSLGAFATVNHLHFQAYYLSVPFPVEKAPTQRMMSSRGLLDGAVIVSQLLNYPVQGLIFEGGVDMCDLANAVADSCICLQNNNIPFNVLISKCGKRIFLFPQCYAEKQALGEVSKELLDTQVNPAVWEISGHMVLKGVKDYENASEGNALRLLAEVSLSQQRFEEVKAFIKEAAGLEGAETERETDNTNEKGALHKPHAPCVACLFPEDCVAPQ